MPEPLMVKPHTEAEIAAFARKVRIAPERARYIDAMRPMYLCHEHDYFKESRKDGHPLETR